MKQRWSWCHVDDRLSLGVSTQDECDICHGGLNLFFSGSTTLTTCWINGPVGLHRTGDTVMAAFPEHYPEPQELAELHLYICRGCLIKALSRTFRSDEIPDFVAMNTMLSGFLREET
ncbi:MAG TPA: hypothetical protein VK821_10880 [Dehalococcoidia bacterium]|nr:hypothetical protein [Dehalococcoidia bacterium]